MRFSIITPVYNVENYIRRCMASVAAQTFRDYEVIVIDDGSTDDSMVVVNEFALQDPERFRILHQENKRQGAARNAGIAIARGEYLIFLDSDDYIAPNMLEDFDRILSEKDCDIFIFNMHRVTEQGEFLSCYQMPLADGTYTDTSAERASFWKIHAAPITKAVKRSFFEDIQVPFPERMLFEDVVTYLWLMKAKRIEIRNLPRYFYVKRESSTVHQIDVSTQYDLIRSLEVLRQRLIEDQMYEIERDCHEAFILNCIYGRMEYVHKYDKKYELKNMYGQYVKQNIPNYMENAYLTAYQKQLLYFVCLEDDLKYRRFIRTRQMKIFLLRFPLISFLNRQRKKLHNRH